MSFAALDSVGARSLHEEQQQEDEELVPRGTQLGYHDPEVGEWRERMVRKMAGKGDTTAKGTVERVRTIGTVRDVGGGEGRRTTRQKGLRRQGF